MENEELLGKVNNYLAMEEHPVFREEILELVEGKKWDELQDRFYRDLEFGTGGLRGVIGGGYNRMNPFVVRRATRGLAQYVLDQNPEGGCSAVIAYDSRRYSDLFALEAAKILASNGIKTYLFSGLRPTPVLSLDRKSTRLNSSHT